MGTQFVPTSDRGPDSWLLQQLCGSPTRNGDNKGGESRLRSCIRTIGVPDQQSERAIIRACQITKQYAKAKRFICTCSSDGPNSQ